MGIDFLFMLFLKILVVFSIIHNQTLQLVLWAIDKDSPIRDLDTDRPIKF